MNDVIQCLEKETGRPCYDTFRRCLDQERATLIEYDDSLNRDFMKDRGETIRYGGARDISDIAKNWLEHPPPFQLFMDGSRRTYKIADIPIGTQVFPIVAGQVGVGVCKRENRRMSACKLARRTVLALPDKIDTEGKNEKQHRAFRNDLIGKLNAAQNKVTLEPSFEGSIIFA